MSLINGLNIFSLVAANIISDSFWCGDWRTIQITAVVSGVTDGNGFSLRFPGSVRATARPIEARPDFNSASTVDNSWGYVFFNTINDQVNFDGATGITFDAAAENGTYQIEILTNGLMWVGAEVFNYQDGEVTVDLSLTDRYLN